MTDVVFAPLEPGGEYDRALQKAINRINSNRVYGYNEDIFDEYWYGSPEVHNKYFRIDVDLVRWGIRNRVLDVDAVIASGTRDDMATLVILDLLYRENRVELIGTDQTNDKLRSWSQNEDDVGKLGIMGV